MPPFLLIKQNFFILLDFYISSVYTVSYTETRRFLNGGSVMKNCCFVLPDETRRALYDYIQKEESLLKLAARIRVKYFQLYNPLNNRTKINPDVHILLTRRLFEKGYLDAQGRTVSR